MLGVLLLELHGTQVWLRDFERIRDGSEAAVALQHLTINPGRPWTAAERDDAVSEILRTLGAAGHAHVLIAHRNKPRARGRAGAGRWRARPSQPS